MCDHCHPCTIAQKAWLARQRAQGDFVTPRVPPSSQLPLRFQPVFFCEASEQIQRTFGGRSKVADHVRINHGGLHAAVPEKLLLLDLADIDPTHEQVGGEGMT